MAGSFTSNTLIGLKKGTKEELIYFLGYFLEFFPKRSHEYSLEYFLEVYFIKNFVEYTLKYFLEYSTCCIGELRTRSSTPSSTRLGTANRKSHTTTCPRFQRRS